MRDESPLALRPEAWAAPSPAHLRDPRSLRGDCGQRSREGSRGPLGCWLVPFGSLFPNVSRSQSRVAPTREHPFTAVAGSLRQRQALPAFPHTRLSSLVCKPSPRIATD